MLIDHLPQSVKDFFLLFKGDRIKKEHPLQYFLVFRADLPDALYGNAPFRIQEDDFLPGRSTMDRRYQTEISLAAAGRAVNGGDDVMVISAT